MDAAGRGRSDPTRRTRLLPQWGARLVSGLKDGVTDPDTTPSQRASPSVVIVMPRSCHRCGGSAGSAPAPQFSAVASGTLRQQDMPLSSRSCRGADLAWALSDFAQNRWSGPGLWAHCAALRVRALRPPNPHHPGGTIMSRRLSSSGILAAHPVAARRRAGSPTLQARPDGLCAAPWLRTGCQPPTRHSAVSMWCRL